jgi:hypothetical protein
VDNVYCDTMHDLFEGVCPYVIQKLLLNLIFVKKLLNTSTLNHRMQFFVYDHYSAPACPKEQHIKTDEVNMSAVEILNFVLGLPLSIGDLVPLEDELWEVLLLLQRVVLYAYGLKFTVNEPQFMEAHILEFLAAYSSRFCCNFTSRFHNLTHYPMII